MKIMKIYLLFAIVLPGLSISSDLQASVTVGATINTPYIFSPQVDTTHGIIGIVNPGGKITVQIYDLQNSTLMYEGYITQTTDTYMAISNTYSKTELGPGATYYPATWRSTDLKNAVFAMDRKHYDNSTERPYAFLQNPISLAITITISNASANRIQIPGIGIFDGNGESLLFNSKHFCANLNNTAHPACVAWTKTKEPNVYTGSDLMVAAHRGFWGSDLGNSSPENSAASIEQAKLYTSVVETDIMIMNDGYLVASHDYTLSRLSDYPGPSTDYLFDLNYDDIATLNLRKRNTSISDYGYLSIYDMIQLVIDNGLVLAIDIKDTRARYDSNGNCIANCDYDPKTNPNASQLIMDSWKKIFKGCVEVAKAQNALQHISFKIPYPYDTIKGLVSDDDLAQIMHMPLLHPTTDPDAITKAINFITAWSNQVGAKGLAAIEANFTQKTDPYLQPFNYGGIPYQNLLEYIYLNLGLRTGCFAEEPVGPKGVVNRWAEWKMKDVTKDIRGDHLEYMNIPYGRIMLLTSDRPDVWLQVGSTYK